MVLINGHAHYLGRYDSPESWECYHRLIADLHAGRRVLSADKASLGRGPRAELAAARVEEGKSRREEVRKEVHATKDELRTLDSLIAVVDRGVARLLEATSMAQGYYRSHGN